MFEVTEKADGMIKDFIKDKGDIAGIRLFLAQGGCSGPSLGMALDEPKDDDQVFEMNELTYMINKDLFEQVKPISVDFVDTPMGSGFSIQSNLNAGAGCGTSCSSCGC